MSQRVFLLALGGVRLWHGEADRYSRSMTVSNEDQRNIARDWYSQHIAFIEAGFTVDQAFQMTHSMFEIIIDAKLGSGD